MVAIEQQTADRPRRGSLSLALGRWWPWTPAVLAAVYLLLLAVQFTQVVAATYLNADAASAPVIGALVGHGHGQVVLGNLPWYSTLLFELATRWLPLHRQLWELAPYAMAFASIVLIAAALWRVSGRWAALLAAALLVCASPQLLLILFSLDDHSPSWFTLALLGWWLVTLERSDARTRGHALWLLAGGISIALIAGVNAASDRLVVVGGLLPLLLAGALAWALGPSRASRNAALAALATVALAVLVALLTSHLMREHEVIYSGHFAFGEPARVQANLTLWWQALVFLANGNFFGAAIGLTGILAAACAIVVLAAAVGALRIGWLELGPSASSTPWTGRRPEPGRTAHVAFWTAAGLLVSAAFVFSSSPEGLESGRYLVGVLYAVAALVPLLVDHRPRLRGAVVAGALVYCLGGTIAMARGTATDNPSHFPDANIAGQVAALAARDHLSHGYAGYWDAATITWAAHLRVHVYPVFTCPPGLCEFDLHTIASWYRPHAGQRTFLLTDSIQPFLGTPPATLGQPIARYPIGQVTMYVYPYDIASRIAPPYP
jgi:hypothetical protein